MTKRTHSIVLWKGIKLGVPWLGAACIIELNYKQFYKKLVYKKHEAKIQEHLRNIGRMSFKLQLAKPVFASNLLIKLARK